MIELLSLLLDVLHILFDHDLLLSSLERIRVQKFTIESSNLFWILEQLSIGNGKFFFFFLLLEAFFFFIYFSAFELFLLKFSKPLFFFSFFEVFGIVYPLIGSFLTL